jgi:hypothetical protein
MAARLAISNRPIVLDEPQPSPSPTPPLRRIHCLVRSAFATSETRRPHESGTAGEAPQRRMKNDGSRPAFVSAKKKKEALT